MNLIVPTSDRPRAAFTIPELMVAMTVFSFVVVGIIFAHLYGLTMFRLTETTLTTTADARQAAAELTRDIHTCNRMLIGNVKNGEFVELVNGEKQEGSSVAIFPTASTNKYTIYFVNPADQTFRRTTDKPSSSVILAEAVTNAVAFRAENHLGVVQTNKLNNRVIHYQLEFYHPRRYRKAADYFKLESSITRRAE